MRSSFVPVYFHTLYYIEKQHACQGLFSSCGKKITTFLLHEERGHSVKTNTYAKTILDELQKV